MPRRWLKLTRPWTKHSGQTCVNSSSRTAEPRGLGTGGATLWPNPHKLSLCQPFHLETLCPSPSLRPMNTSLGRTRQGARWSWLLFSSYRPRSPPAWCPGAWGLAPHQSLAQPQQSSSTWQSVKQVRVVWAPWAVQVLGTYCPGSPARRAAGEGQARTPSHEPVGGRCSGMIWEGWTSSWPSQDIVQVGQTRPDTAATLGF